MRHSRTVDSHFPVRFGRGGVGHCRYLCSVSKSIYQVYEGGFHRSHCIYQRSGWVSISHDIGLIFEAHDTLVLLLLPLADFPDGVSKTSDSV